MPIKMPIKGIDRQSIADAVITYDPETLDMNRTLIIRQMQLDIIY